MICINIDYSTKGIFCCHDVLEVRSNGKHLLVRTRLGGLVCFQLARVRAIWRADDVS
jgi:hypothetical protein